VLDLTRVPPVPSFFAPGARQSRSSILFLSRFADGEISRPIERDERIHIEYIPTQVMTEYFRREFAEAHLLGIRYASAMHAGGVCTALFAGAAAVLEGFPGEEEPEGRWLRLVRRWERQRGS
jgi:RES domain